MAGTAMHSIIVAVLALAFLTVCPSAAFAQVDPANLGTWTLNLARSVFRLGPQPVAQTQVWEPSGDGVTVTVETVAGPGVRIEYGYTASVDGREYPMRGDLTPNGAETIALTRLDAHTLQATMRRAGEVVLTTRITLSGDGRVLTLASTGTNRNEQPTDSVAVFDKQ